jgi:hypothetical protein
LAGDLRLITRACAKRFFGCATAAEVFAQHGKTPIMRAYRSQKPETWFTEGGAEAGLRDRTVGLGKRQARPGPRKIGQVKIMTPARRAWVWRDDWSVTGTPLTELPVFWMIAEGKRVKDSRNQDLQEIAQDILHSPDDAWRPVKADYDIVAAAVLEEEARADEQSIHKARDEAHRHPDTVVPVTLSRLDGLMTEERVDERDAAGVIIEEMGLRFFIVSRRFGDGSWVPEPQLVRLATIAFDDLSPGAFEEAIAVPLEGVPFDASTQACYVAEVP